MKELVVKIPREVESVKIVFEEAATVNSKPAPAAPAPAAPAPAAPAPAAPAAPAATEKRPPGRPPKSASAPTPTATAPGKALPPPPPPRPAPTLPPALDVLGTAPESEEVAKMFDRREKSHRDIFGALVTQCRGSADWLRDPAMMEWAKGFLDGVHLKRAVVLESEGRFTDAFVTEVTGVLCPA